jgi:hypothetical protein
MKGKSRIESLTSEWYGFTVVSFLVHGLLALFGSGVFAVVTVPLVIGFAVISLAITWGIGRLLIGKSSLTRIVLLVLSPIVMVLGCVSLWQLLTGPWSIGMVITTLLTAAGAWMQLHSFLTLMDKDVRAYFR